MAIDPVLDRLNSYQKYLINCCFVEVDGISFSFFLNHGRAGFRINGSLGIISMSMDSIKPIKSFETIRVLVVLLFNVTLISTPSTSVIGN
jgi:hypothetical protein